MGYKCYSNKRLKQKLKEKYRDCPMFSESCGRTDILCFQAAAKIIKPEIREVEKSNKYYPTNLEVQDLKTCSEWIPESLMTLLKIVMPNLLKQTVIAHSMIQAARPRSALCPILFGLNVQLGKEFDSKWLISHLHKLTFSISPDKIQKYKQSPVVSDDKDTTQEIEEADEIEEAGPSEVNTTGELDVTNYNVFAQWSDDNVDNNIITLTKKGTFHGMGIISMSNDCSTTKIIKRLKYTFKSSEFGKLHHIQIHQYLSSSTKGLAALSFINIKHLLKPLVKPKEVGYDLLWQTSRPLRNDPTPNWLGLMQELLKSETPVQNQPSHFHRL